MRFPTKLTLAGVVALATLAPHAGAQSSSRRGAYDIRDSIKKRWAEKRAGKSGTSSTPAPTGPGNANTAGFAIPQGTGAQTAVPGQPQAFPVFQPTKPAAGATAPAPASAAAAVAPAPAPAPRPAPRPRVAIVPGLRAPSVRTLETPEDVEEFEKVERVRKTASVQMAVQRAADDHELTEVDLVQRVLAALEIPAPPDAEALQRTGLRIRPNKLEAGDLLFFQIPHGGKITDHVAVFFGQDQFAYVGPRGVGVAPLDDTWRGRLKMVRRPR